MKIHLAAKWILLNICFQKQFVVKKNVGAYYIVRCSRNIMLWKLIFMFTHNLSPFAHFVALVFVVVYFIVPIAIFPWEIPVAFPEESLSPQSRSPNIITDLPS